MTSRREDGCIGRDYTCPTPALYLVAGDGACRVHLPTIVRQRIVETGGGVLVEPWRPFDDDEGA